VGRQIGGWKKGKEKDVIEKRTPYIVSYDQLEEEVKNYDREPVRLIRVYCRRLVWKSTV
jgi:hypothetical protein